MIPYKCPKCGASRHDVPWVQWDCGNHPGKLTDTRDCLRGQRDQLAAENAALRERVKLLEARGDEMSLYLNKWIDGTALPHDKSAAACAVDGWAEAKEAKP